MNLNPREYLDDLAGLWTTSDLALAAYLRLQKHPVKPIRRRGGRRAFVFQESPALGEDVRRFRNREARVDPVAFMESLHILQGALRDGA
jgi:hypothetical protein